MKPGYRAPLLTWGKNSCPASWERLSQKQGPKGQPTCPQGPAPFWQLACSATRLVSAVFDSLETQQVWWVSALEAPTVVSEHDTCHSLGRLFEYQGL